MSIKTYSELSKLTTFAERFDYLKLTGKIGESTFGRFRYINQGFYMSRNWKTARNEVILRDCGCDLGIPGLEILDRVIIHHINPITAEQIEKEDPIIYDPEFLICVSDDTHRAIHFGDASRLKLRKSPPERRPGDHCPWK